MWSALHYNWVKIFFDEWFKVYTWIPCMLDYFQVKKTHKHILFLICNVLISTNTVVDLYLSSHLSLHDYMGFAPPGKSGNIFSAAMIGPCSHFRLFTVVWPKLNKYFKYLVTFLCFPCNIHYFQLVYQLLAPGNQCFWCSSSFRIVMHPRMGCPRFSQICLRPYFCYNMILYCIM